MSSIKFELTDSNAMKYESSFTDEMPKLVLNDKCILQLCALHKIDKLTNLSIKLGVRNMAVIIENYTLTNTIYFSEFYDIQSHISIFQSKGTNIDIVGQSIQHLQADCKKMLFSNCNIEKFEIGMFEQHSRLGKQDFPDIFRADSLDIRDSIITKLDIYAECKNVNLQGCNVGEFNNYGNLFKGHESKVELFHLWQNTNIRKLLLSNEIVELKFDDSTIERLFARPNLRIDNIEVINSIIEYYHGFTKENFISLNYDNWYWIGNSASNEQNLQLRTEANYQMAKSAFKAERKSDKYVSALFDFCVGYGYKPLRILRATTLLTLFNAIIFTIIDIVNILNIQVSIPINVDSFCKGLLTFGNNFLLAIANLAGQINFQMSDGLPFWLSVAEYLLGVVLFAMFVNALYVRYKE